MASQRKALGVPLSSKGLWLYRGRWLVVAFVLALVAAIFSVAASAMEWEAFLRLGLLQPGLAAIVAMTVVLSMRLIWGRFANDRRKGVRTASSAAIAVRLWAMCFTLIVGAMLVSALVARLPDRFPTQADTPPKVVEERSEVRSAAGAPTVSHSVKVTR